MKNSVARFALLLACLLMATSALASDPRLHLARLAGEPDAVPAVLSGALDARFIEMPDAVMRPQPTVTGWWRLTSARDWPAAEHPVLVLNTATLTRLELWRPGHSQPQLREKMGPNADYSYSGAVLTLPLEGGVKAGEPIYLHVETSSVVAHPITIQPEQELRVEDQQRVRDQSLLHGTLLALTLAGLGLGLALRESTFLLLAGGLASSLLYLLAGSGEIYRIDFFASVAAKLPQMQRLGGLSASILIALFLRRYLMMPQRAPRLAKLQWLVIIVFALVLVISLLPGGIGRDPIWSRIGNFNLVVSSIIALAAAFISTAAGDRPARLFLFSWFPLLLMSIWRVYEVTAGVAYNPVINVLFPLSYLFLGIMLFIGLGERMMQYKRERDAADLLARRDPLTGVYNRRALDERLHAAAIEANQMGRPLALLFADLDHFKRVNDTHGHDVGDECLREASRRIRSSLRFGDILGRFGGEEFVVGLPGMTADEAMEIGERIRQKISAEPIAFGERSLSLTISIGVAVLDRGGLASFDEAIKRADRALYVSKRAGRDRVSLLAS